MPRTKKGTPPSYPTTAHKGQARVTVRLADGRRHGIYLGPFGSEESRSEYRRVLAELDANGGYYPVADNGEVSEGLTVAEMLVHFWKHAKRYYRLVDGSPSREQEHYKVALRPVLDLYPATLASEFGPLALKAVRQRMLDQRRYRVRFGDGKEMWLPETRFREGDGEAARGQRKHAGTWVPVELLKTRPALSRKVINQRVEHVKRVWGWAVSEELVPAATHDALLRVRGLRRGHEGTYDRPRVKPVGDADVEATLPHLLPQVRTMVQLQRLMGARPTEICLIRGRDIDRSGPVWWYRIDPNEIERDETEGRAANLHKTAHHENSDGSATVKLLPIGPRGQRIIRPWLRANLDEPLFQPAEARQAWYAERRGARKTPLYPSHARHQAEKRKAKPKRAPRDHYDRHSYDHAVRRACLKAGVKPWHPHQLKHSISTLVRERYDAEAARVYVGHQHLSTTEIYAEKNMREVARIALAIG